MSRAPRFFLGAMSPYSWFAAERIGDLIPRARWCPVFAGGLFRAAHRTSWGLTDARDAGVADCEARARAHGLGPITWPDPWPTNDIAITRALVHADLMGSVRELALVAMRLAFCEGSDLGELSTVSEAARRAGLDPDATQRAIASDEIKASTRDATNRAVALGVFGVPTIVVGDERFWGDDQLQDAADAARSY